MTVAEIVQMITNVGFPIACCIFMWRYITSCQKETTESINNNTRIIEKLVDKLNDE